MDRTTSERVAKGERAVSDFDRILVAYGERQSQMVDALVAELEATPEERARLRVVAQLVQQVVHTFGTLETDWAALSSHDFVERRAPSPLPVIVDAEPGQVLNLSMRALVDAGVLTAWQARVINMNLGLKRSMFVCGPADAGKSTLLNGLIGLLPVGQRLALVEADEEALPMAKERSGAHQLSASGTLERVEAFRQASRQKPDWIAVRGLTAEESFCFVDALQGSCGGLATVVADRLEVPFNAWLSEDRKMAQRLSRLKPLVVHLRRDDEGRPRLVALMEVSVREGRAVLTPYTGLT